MTEELKRQSIRLKKYDYSEAGAYFVTICIHKKACLLANPNDLKPNLAGQMVHKIWSELRNKFENVQLDEFIIMPNHVHGILFLKSVGANQGILNVGTPLVGAQSRRAGTRPAPT